MYRLYVENSNGDFVYKGCNISLTGLSSMIETSIRTNKNYYILDDQMDLVDKSPACVFKKPLLEMNEVSQGVQL